MEASAGRGLSDWLSKKWLVWLSYEYPWVGWCCLSPLSDFILSVCLVIPWISLIGYCLSSDYYQACVWLQVLINLLQDKWSAVSTYPPSNTTTIPSLQTIWILTLQLEMFSVFPLLLCRFQPTNPFVGHKMGQEMENRKWWPSSV